MRRDLASLSIFVPMRSAPGIEKSGSPTRQLSSHEVDVKGIEAPSYLLAASTATNCALKWTLGYIQANLGYQCNIISAPTPLRLGGYLSMWY